jgi:hypothetical protein
MYVFLDEKIRNSNQTLVTKIEKYGIITLK